MGTTIGTHETGWAEERRDAHAIDETRRWAQVVENIYRLHYADLCRCACRYVDTRPAAEDVVQEAFSRFASMSHRPAEGSELPYLRSIVMNEARSVLRRRLVRDRHLETVGSLYERDTTLDHTLQRDEARSLQRVLDALPLRQRQVVTLRHLAGFSELETATVLAISSGSVKTHASRGLAAMRNRMGDVA